MTTNIDKDITETAQEIRDLRAKLEELESQGLYESTEYEELAEEYQMLLLDTERFDYGECKMYIYENDSDLEASFYGTYDSYIDACDCGDDMMESGSISGFFITTED